MGILTAAIGTGFRQPIIATQPQSQTNVAGTDATFSVEATGTPVRVPPSIYQKADQSVGELGGQRNIQRFGRWRHASILPVAL